MPIKKSFLEQKLLYRITKVIYLILPLLAAVVLFLKGYLKIPTLFQKGVLDISQKNILDLLQKNGVSLVYVAVGLVLYYLILQVLWKSFLYIAFGGLEYDTKNTVSGQPTPLRQEQAQTMQLIPLIIILGVIIIYLLSAMKYIKLPKIDLNLGQPTPTVRQPTPVPSHPYGASCTDSKGKTGLYGTNGTCYTCSGSTAVTNPINNSNCSNGIAGVYCYDDGKKTDKCISTGCGSWWYCSGSYYLSGVQIRVTGGCFPSGLRPSEIYSGWSGTCRQCP
ncbi:MAG TPA: hypothetical protein DDZ05_01075 [Candidatus Blackburnbacteria bacterium]|nr:hypothetical protein [Candidatus Blackburnbacteria bacterium]